MFIRLFEYEACDNLSREIMEQLTLRDREPRSSQAFVSLSANIRMRLKQYSTQVKELKIKVNEARRQRIMYPWKFINLKYSYLRESGLCSGNVIDCSLYFI